MAGRNGANRRVVRLVNWVPVSWLLGSASAGIASRTDPNIDLERILSLTFAPTHTRTAGMQRAFMPRTQWARNLIWHTLTGRASGEKREEKRHVYFLLTLHRRTMRNNHAAESENLLHWAPIIIASCCVSCHSQNIASTNASVWAKLYEPAWLDVFPITCYISPGHLACLRNFSIYRALLVMKLRAEFNGLQFPSRYYCFATINENENRRF